MQALTSSGVPVTVVDVSGARPVTAHAALGVVEMDAVADVHVEVTFVLGALVDHCEPRLAAGDGDPAEDPGSRPSTVVVANTPS